MSGKNDTKHTPGPWHNSNYQTHPNFQVFGPNDEFVGEASTEANARLIAAAPELLEALKNLVAAYYSAIHDEYYGTEILSCLLGEADSARAAIAKAEVAQQA